MRFTYIGFVLIGLLALLVSLLVTSKLMDHRLVSEAGYQLSAQAEQQKRQEAVDKIEEELKHLLSTYRNERNNE